MKLIKLDLNSYVLIRGKNAVHGDVERMVGLLDDMGIEYKETEEAFVMLLTSNHDVAHFGMHGTFIFSENVCLTNERIAV
jgi:hypothetical protein